MKGLSGMSLAAFVVVCARAVVAEDTFALIQQTLGSVNGLGLSAAAGFEQAAPFEFGDEMQVHLDGADGWVDCTVSGHGDAPATYNIQVPTTMDGILQDKAYSNVPVNNLRKVFKGFDVNIETGPDESTWVPCILLTKSRDAYTVELLDLRPGHVVRDVPPSLLRESEERKRKAQAFKEMVAENEAKKNDLFYIAQVKEDPKKEQEEQKKAEKAAADSEDYESMRSEVWEEMARRADKKNEERKAAREAAEKKKQEKKAKRIQQKQDREDREMEKLAKRAQTNKVAAFFYKQKEAAKDRALFAQNLKKQVNDAKRLRQLESQLAEQKAIEEDERKEMLEQRQVAMFKGMDFKQGLSKDEFQKNMWAMDPKDK